MRYLATAALFCAFFSAEAFAQGIVLERIIVETTPPPETPRTPQGVPPRRWPMTLKDHRVEITIEDQAVVTKVTQVFHNPNAWQMEGVYLFPLPENASVSRFTMSMAGKQVPGEILDSKRARDIYRSIVHRRDDPGLLEYAGRRLIRARLFPLLPRSDTKVELRYEQVLEPVGGMIEMIYPFKSDKFAPGLVHSSGSIEIKSAAGVQTVFSPSHSLDVVRKNDTHVIASFEEKARADRDLRILYSLGRKDFGLSLATHRPTGEDGYFMMIVSPNTREQREVLNKDVMFVVDTSGSMGDRGGAKMKQAKSALQYALGRLAPGDRFNVIAFATEARPFRDGVVSASAENVAAAMEFVNKLEPTGGTAIHEALTEALRLERSEGRVPIVFFLTDGEPTIGPTDTGTIIDAARRANGANARLFVFGVGDDVNATLLTDLSDKNRGSAHFVSELENIELKVSALYDQVASPVMTDVAVKLGGAGVYDVYPRDLGDLFKGQQVMVIGRYKTAGPRAVTLTGRVGKKEMNFVYEGTFGTQNDREYLPRLWAVRKVGFLLAEIRRNGEKTELVAEVRKLGTRHGIVTPYTSWLVVEEQEMLRRNFRGRLGAEDSDEGRRVARVERELIAGLEVRAAAAADAGAALKKKAEAGKGAVAGARFSLDYARAEQDSGVAGVGVKSVGDRTFRLVDGVWIDIEKIPGRLETIRVKYLSKEYDELLEDDQLARLLSVGAKMRFVYNGKIYEIYK